MNSVPFTHLSRALGCLSRFQDQLKNNKFLGSRVSAAVQNTATPGTLPSQHPSDDHGYDHVQDQRVEQPISSTS